MVVFVLELLDLDSATLVPDFSSNLVLSVAIPELNFVGKRVDKEFELPIIFFLVLSSDTMVDE